MLRLASIVTLLAAFGFAIWAGSADDPLRQRMLAGWFGILLGAGLVLRGGVRLQEGDVRLKSRTVQREENPGLYKIGIALLIVPGLIMVVGGAYLLVGG